MSTRVKGRDRRSCTVRVASGSMWTTSVYVKEEVTKEDVEED